MFHTHDGWFFERRSEGSVRVLKYDGMGFPESSAKVLDVVLDANTWASVVASMSTRGETAESFREVFLFHTGKSFD